MNTLEAITTRYSVRKYKSDAVSKDDLQKIVEAGIRAPSSMNRQPWRFVVVTDPDIRSLLVTEAKAELIKYLETDEAKSKWDDGVERFKLRAKEDGDMIFYDAPAVIFVIQTKDINNGNFDHGLAVQNILLSAHELGYGTVPVGLSKPMNNSEKARGLLKMKPEEKLVIAVPVGYSDETPDEKDRDFDVVDFI